MQAYIQPVGCHSLGIQHPSLFLCHPTGKVLINVPENLQRLSTEHKLRLSKIEDILVSRLTPESTGGLPGLLLTLEALEAPTWDSASNRAAALISRRNLKIPAHPDRSLQFGSTFVGSRWIDCTGVTEPAPGVQEVWCRPLLLRKRTPNIAAATDQVSETTATSASSSKATTTNANACGARASSSDDPATVWANLHARQHTVRSIRLWGPPGLLEFLQEFCDLCGRLSRLSVQVMILDTKVAVNLPVSCAQYSPAPFSAISAGLQCTWVTVHTEKVPPAKKPRLDPSSHLTSTSEAARESGAAEESVSLHCKVPRGAVQLYAVQGPAVSLVVGKGERQAGKFLIAKAKALNIPAGPDYGKLKNGEAVTLADGRTIQPEEVCEESLPGLPYVILNCQTAGEVRVLLDLLDRYVGPMYQGPESVALPQTAEELSQWLAAPRSEAMLVHMSDFGVSQTAEYRQLVTRIVSKWKQCREHHTQVDPRTRCPCPFISVESLNGLLAESAPTVHQAPTEPDIHSPTVISQNNSENQRAPARLQFLATYLIIPQSKIRSPPTAPLNLAEAAATRLVQLQSKARRQPPSAEEAAAAACIPPFPAVRLLGTGAAIPSKYRNVSSTLVQINEDCAYLFDCGEGTTTQLYSCVPSGDQGAFFSLLNSIRAVFISHKHADHLMGLVTFAKTKWDLTRSRFVLIVPTEVEAWCAHTLPYQAVEKIIHADDLDCPSSPLRDDNSGIPGLEVLRWSTGYLMAQSCLVDHIMRWDSLAGQACPSGSFGFKTTVVEDIVEPEIKDPATRSTGPGSNHRRRTITIAFSGDLAPCAAWDSLLQGGVDCLIHEATFEDSLLDEAQRRYHCTITHAVDAARKARAQLLVLTHFSQRYPSVPTGLFSPRRRNEAGASRSGTGSPSSVHGIAEMMICYGVDRARCLLSPIWHDSDGPSSEVAAQRQRAVNRDFRASFDVLASLSEYFATAEAAAAETGDDEDMVDVLKVDQPGGRGVR